MTNRSTLRSTLQLCSVLVPTVLACGFAVGCGGESSNSPPPNQMQGQYPQQAGYPQQPGYPQQQPPGYPAPTAAQPGYPAATPGYPQAAPAQPAPAPAPAPNPMGDAANVAIQAVAMAQAPGMSPEGQRFDAQISEGQHAATTVTMQAGKCYTVVGVGYPPGILQLEMHLLAPPLYTTSSGDDVSATPTAIIGKGAKALCPVTPFPVPYKLDIVAKKGSGGVAVQVYSKAK